MKYTLLLFILALGSMSLRAQEVQESLETMSLGEQNALILEIPYDDQFAAKEWKNYLKTFKGKTKKVKRSKELFTDDASIPYISSNTVDIYSVVEKNGADAQLKLWMDLGGGFMDSQNFPDAYSGAKTLLAGFEKHLNVEDIKLELKGEEKRLKDLEKDLAKLERLNEKYHKEIEDWKGKIAENEDLIEVNFSDQDQLRKTIESQKGTVKEVELKLAKAES